MVVASLHKPAACVRTRARVLLPLQLIYKHFFWRLHFSSLSILFGRVVAVFGVRAKPWGFICVRIVRFPIKLWSIFSILLWQLLWDHYVWFLKPFTDCTKSVLSEKESLQLNPQTYVTQASSQAMNVIIIAYVFECMNPIHHFQTNLCSLAYMNLIPRSPSSPRPPFTHSHSLFCPLNNPSFNMYR